MSERFSTHVALVTGAARGIGRATALRFAEEGARVHAVDLDTEGLEETARIGGDGVSVGHLDVTEPMSCRSAVSSALDVHGRLDVLANVAGIGQLGPIDHLSFDEWRRVLSVDLDGVFLMSTAALPALTKTHGCIVNVASVAALFGQPYTTAYTVAKAGVVALTKSMGVELQKRNVRVNCVCPGGVATEFAATLDFSGLDEGLMKRTFMKMVDLVSPEEVAAAIAFLASDDARSITATALSIDHGMHSM